MKINDPNNEFLEKNKQKIRNHIKKYTPKQKLLQMFTFLNLKISSISFITRPQISFNQQRNSFIPFLRSPIFDILLIGNSFRPSKRFCTQ